MATGNPILDALHAGDNSGDGGDEKLQQILAASLDELEKTAAAGGYDLSSLSDDDIAEMVAEIAQQQHGVGGADGAGDSAFDEQVKVAEYLGRVQAQAYADEILSIQKQASAIELDPSQVDQLAQMNAMDILVTLNQLDPRTDGAAIQESNGREKVASVLLNENIAPVTMEAIEVRTMEHLQAAGWDVEKIAFALTQLANS